MRILTVVFLLLCSSMLWAQDRVLLLSDYIQQLEEQHQVVFSYNNSWIKGVKVTLSSFPKDLTPSLKQLTENSAFKFEKVNDSNVLVKAKKNGKNQLLCIHVVDAETSESIYGASVVNTRTNTGYIINENVSSRYINLNDWDSVRVKFIGYEEQKLPIDYFNGKPCQTIQLKESESKLKQVTITGYLNRGIDYQHSDHSINLKVSGAGLLPGETETDILTTMDALPGINSPDGKAGNLVMRGDDPDKTMISFDGIPVYHNGHYFGAFSAYNSNIVESVKINRSGYGAEKGGKVGGMVQLKSKVAIPDSLQYGIGASTTYLSGYVVAPLANNKMSLTLGGRTSYPFDWNSPKIEAITDFVFQNSAITRAEHRADVMLNNFGLSFSDYNAKWDYDINDDNKISVSYIHINNDFNLEIYDSRRQETNTDIASLFNNGLGINYYKNWNPRLITESSITYSNFKQNFHTDIVAPHDTIEVNDYVNTIKDIAFVSKSTYLVGARDHLEFGLNLNHYQVYSYRNIDRDVDPLLDIDDRQANVHTAFISYTHKPKDWLQATLGLRNSYYTLLAKNYLEPRFMANVFVNNKITLKTNMGLYNQFVNHLYGTRALGAGVEHFNWRLSNDSNTPVVNSKQIMTGGIFSHKGWVFDVEWYYKQTNNIAIHNQYDYQNTEDHFIGDYNTIGTDFLLKKSWKNLDIWLGYTYANTRVQFDSIQSTSFPSIWNQDHLFNTVVSYNWNNLKVSVGWKYKSGLATLTGIRYLYTNGPSTAPTGPGAPINDIPYQYRVYTSNSDPDYGNYFPDQHQMDVSVSYSYSPKNKGWNCNIGASVTNVYDNKIITGQVEKVASGPPPVMYVRSNLYGMGICPSLKIMMNF